MSKYLLNTDLNTSAYMGEMEPASLFSVTNGGRGTGFSHGMSKGFLGMPAVTSRSGSNRAVATAADNEWLNRRRTALHRQAGFGRQLAATPIQDGAKEFLKDRLVKEDHYNKLAGAKPTAKRIRLFT